MTYKLSLTSIFLVIIISLSCKKTFEYSRVNIVINEVMPVNSSTQADPDGEYDDWIEIYNLTDESIDLSGYFLSDDKKDPGKWQFPDNTQIGPKGYLIIWADDDGAYQQGLHANFKLSSAGESVLISDPNKLEIDKMSYPEQNLELSYARIPNGTGDFKWNTPSYNKFNGNE